MHAIKEKPVVVNGEIVIRPIMVVALTYDHRLLDGREAVTFLGTSYFRSDAVRSRLLRHSSPDQGVHRGSTENAVTLAGMKPALQSCDFVIVVMSMILRSEMQHGSYILHDRDTL